ncbi:MAG: ATP-binding protein [Acidimicrobiales bacterium]
MQTAWDRALRRVPVLVVLIGSDLAMMDALGEYGRPLYDRLRILRLEPLAPSEVAALTGLGTSAAIDLYLAVGGFPNLVRLAARRGTFEALIRRELEDPTSPLLVAGERAVAAEFPPQVPASGVLVAVGAGAGEHRAIASVSGIGGATLDRALDTLVTKRVVVRRRPYSAEGSAGRRTRYEVVGPYLRFWLTWLRPGLPEIERGRGALVAERIIARWAAYRGRALEAFAREAVIRMLPDPSRFGAAAHVGAYWTRDGRVEVDLVGGDREGSAERLGFIGSIKWRERTPFDGDDLRALADHASHVPGSEAASLIAVSRTGATDAAANELSVLLGPADLLESW